MGGFDREMQEALEEDGAKLAALTGEDHGPVFLGDELENDGLVYSFEPMVANDYEVEKDGVVLHVMISEWRPDIAHVIERGPNGEGPDKGSYAAYDRLTPAEARGRMLADGWKLKTTKQMVVTERGQSYGTASVSGVCSPDVTVEDVQKRFYHFYFGGRGAWVKDGRFGCTIHTD